jgi:hypothetical protein
MRQRLSWMVTTTGPAALTRWLIRACPAQEARSRPRLHQHGPPGQAGYQTGKFPSAAPLVPVPAHPLKPGKSSHARVPLQPGPRRSAAFPPREQQADR